MYHRSRLFASTSLVALALLVITTSASAPVSAGAAAPARPKPPPVCGQTSPSHAMVEPTDVDFTQLPRNASGERELILAVRATKDGIFCYHYRYRGIVRSGSPTLIVHRGEHFALRVVNDISSQSRGEFVASSALPPCTPMAMPPAPVHHYVGYLNHIIDDRFVKVAPVDTNFHLHGFIGPASQEDIFLSTLSTPMHACEYHVTIPPTQPPGTYFYHPHSHGAADAEIAGGLDGVWIVEPDAPQLPRTADHVVLLTYHLPFANDYNYAPDVDAEAAIGAAHIDALRPAAPVKYDPFNPPPWPLSGPMTFGLIHRDATGCNGQMVEAVVAVDGATAPATLAVPAGQPQLLRIVDGTSDSPKNISLHDESGHVLPMQMVARDGVPVNGDARHPLSGFIPMNAIMLAPFSRADVLVTVSAGQTVVLSSEPFCEGAAAFYQIHHDLLRIAGSAPSVSQPATISQPVSVAQTPAAKLIAFARAHPQRIHRRAITFTEYVLPARGKTPRHAAYFITDTTDPNFHEHEFWPTYANGATVPNNPEIVVKAGTIEEWDLFNATMEAHAFHIHQMSFVQEDAAADVPLTVDSVFVPVGTLLPNRNDPNYPLVKPSVTKLLMDFRHVRRGTFVFHCHMLFHEDHGMMAVIRVE